MHNKYTAEHITRQLGGKWHGDYGRAKCPAHGGDNENLSILQNENGYVKFFCHSRGCDTASIKKAMGQFGVFEDSNHSNHVFTRNLVDDPSRLKLAQKIWNESFNTQGTKAERYLRNRGVYFDGLENLRFTTQLWNAEAKLHLPAMIAAVKISGVDFVGIQRTYLSSDGNQKFDCRMPKKSLGKISGGGVWFGVPLETMYVAEGIETLLSAYTSPIDFCGVAVLSANNFQKLILPELPIGKEIFVIIDKDDNGASLIYAKKASQKWLAQGRNVKFVMPPQGSDLNDVLRGAE